MDAVQRKRETLAFFREAITDEIAFYRDQIEGSKSALARLEYDLARFDDDAAKEIAALEAQSEQDAWEDYTSFPKRISGSRLLQEDGYFPHTPASGSRYRDWEPNHFGAKAQGKARKASRRHRLFG